jgi:uncharacterized protein (UPF0303 family)
MGLEDDLAVISRQESELVFPDFEHAFEQGLEQGFDNDTAWNLGVSLRELAVARGHSVVIDIRRFGQPFEPLFYAALPGTTPDNYRWVERKSNVVARFHRSSYAIGLALQLGEATLAGKYALVEADYAAHGGSFPLHVAGAGIIGAVTVSGLPQREDHNLVVEAMCGLLHLDHEALRLQLL